MLAAAVSQIAPPEPCWSAAPVRVYRHLGSEVRILAGREQTGGAYALLDYTLAARQMGAVPHYHRVMTEAFHVLEGRLTLLEGNRWRVAGPGTLVSIPPGVRHGFRNDGDEPARFHVIATPAGIEELLDELFGYIERSPVWPPPDDDLREVAALGLRHDTCYG